MSSDGLLPIAMIIEPRAMLADTVADALRIRGYEVLVAATHSGGAKAIIADAQVDLLVAAIPAVGESRTGAYLADARARNPALKTVVMLSDPDEDVADAPVGAVKLIKPFTIEELEQALDQAIRLVL
jgi:DNA-binding response OmpR family regulator